MIDPPVPDNQDEPTNHHHRRHSPSQHDLPPASVMTLLDRFSSRVTDLTLHVEHVEKELAEVWATMEQQRHVRPVTLRNRWTDLHRLLYSN